MRSGVSWANVSRSRESDLFARSEWITGGVAPRYKSRLVDCILHSLEPSLCQLRANILRAFGRVRIQYITYLINVSLKNNTWRFPRYALENLKFGKVDIGRYPDAAIKYHISDASTSKQLPTLILFKEGKEIERRPYTDHKGKLVKFLFSLVRVI